MQEKVDGANIGFGLVGGEIRLRNRNYNLNKTFRAATTETRQFTTAWEWLAEHKQQLRELNRAAGTTVVVYAEWLKLTHGIRYTALPDWAVAHSLFDLDNGTWLMPDEAQRLMEAVGLLFVRASAAKFTPEDIRNALESPSDYGAEFREGIVVTFTDRALVKIHHPRFQRGGRPLDMRATNLLRS